MQLGIFAFLYILYYRAFAFHALDSLAGEIMAAKEKNQDQYLASAKSLIAKRQNLTAAKDCLIKSLTVFDSSEAAFFLGKLHLFGPYKEDTSSGESSLLSLCSTDSFPKVHRMYSSYLSNLTEELSLSSEPNLTRAFTFFNYAHMLGHPDAGVFLLYLYTQSQILNNGQALPASVTYDEVFDKFNKAHLRGSLMANAIIANSIVGCNKLRSQGRSLNASLPVIQAKEYFRERNSPFLQLISAPYTDEVECNECTAALGVLIPVLTSIDDYIEQNGGVQPAPQRLDAYDKVHGKGPHKQEAFDQKPSNIEIIKQQAERGDVNAQMALGDLFAAGNPELGIERDIRQAEAYYRRAAYENNNREAQSTLGTLKMKGTQLEKNETEALELLKSAAERGSPDAMFMLANAYLYGTDSMKQHASTAVYWLEKAAALNHTQSEGGLGHLLKWGLNGVQKDEKKAFLYLLRAAKKGHVSSVLDLVVLYLEKRYDRTFEMNLTCSEVLELARKALPKGEFNNWQLKGFQAYREGNYNQAYAYYSFGAFLGLPDSMHASAYLWQEQKFNKSKCLGGNAAKCAFAYYYKLYLTGETRHLTQMAELLSSSSKSQSSEAKLTFKLYNQSVILNNDPQALYSLGWMHENGIGTHKNKTQAVRIYEELMEGYSKGEYGFAAFVAGFLSKTRLQITRFLSLDSLLQLCRVFFNVFRK